MASPDVEVINVRRCVDCRVTKPITQFQGYVCYRCTTLRAASKLPDRFSGLIAKSRAIVLTDLARQELREWRREKKAS